jgi:hypothetical protein
VQYVVCLLTFINHLYFLFITQWTSKCGAFPTKVANKEGYFYVSYGAGMVDEVLSIPSHPDNFNSNPNLAAVVNHCDDTDGDFTVVPLAA